MAQDSTRNWNDGHVVVTHVEIKTGMPNACIDDPNNVWRKFLEEQKEDGSVVAYGMYANSFAREGEPDFILTVTFGRGSAFLGLNRESSLIA